MTSLEKYFLAGFEAPEIKCSTSQTPKSFDGNIFIVDEHAERLWLPQRNAAAIHAMLAGHRVGNRGLRIEDLKRFVAGADVFSRQSDGTIAAQYAKQGIALRCANTDRINGWAEILQRFGDV